MKKVLITSRSVLEAMAMKQNLVFRKPILLQKKKKNIFRFKVGSWSFVGIICLLIYFLKCRKALSTKK